MTGKYIDFKGKLKVGDRVRHNHQSWNAEAEVLEVDEEWFRTTEGCFLWTWDTGTLELLSPSPRVVTLEDLQPGDEVEGGYVGLSIVIDVAKNGRIVFLESKSNPGTFAMHSIEQMRVAGYKPVQPASTPAPAEKEEEWWAGETYMKSGFNGSGYRENLPDIPKIVAEAKRRGAREARKETDELLRRSNKAMLDLLEAVNKPAGAGEK